MVTHIGSRCFLGGKSSCGCSDRTILNSSRPSKRADHGEALRALALCASRTAGGAMWGELGRLLSFNEGYTAGTRKNARV